MGAATNTNAASADDGVRLRKMLATDLPAAHELSDALRWPHRPTDWKQAFSHAEGVVAERDGTVVGTALRFRWGPQDATIGLVIVAPAQQGRRIGHKLMSTLLDGLDSHRVRLNATLEGRGLYERLGFVRVGELRQHQGIAQPAPLVALDSGWRLRPAGASDAPVLKALDAQACGMPRDALLDELLAEAESTVVLDDGGTVRGFGLLRRFGRGHSIGPVVAPDAEGAKALIAHLAGMNAGRFTRIDIDADAGLAEWLEAMGLLRVDAPVVMERGPASQPTAPGAPRGYAIVTQALG
ncbi:GNAT family N-acetyltransferase [Roseateles sp.]|uniref:GNAT family N-acetyltransferase n=1 Tax=Roseateles sp. TaxID=1971397 RepID=UPI0032651DFD